MFIRFEFEAGFARKKGVRRLAGSYLTNDEAPPPQQAEVPSFEEVEQGAKLAGLYVPESPELLEERQPAPPPERKTLRLRANMSVREVAKLLRDLRIRKIVGEHDAGYYEAYAGNNETPLKLAYRLGVSETGFKILMEGVEKKAIIEALALKYPIEITPFVRNGDQHFLTEDHDHAAQDRAMRIEHFTEPEDDGKAVGWDDFGDESSS